MTGPSYTVKNIEAIAVGSEMRARLYTLAPGDVIPWHRTALTNSSPNRPNCLRGGDARSRYVSRITSGGTAFASAAS
jgi:hypothetical protein